MKSVSGAGVVSGDNGDMSVSLLQKPLKQISSDANYTHNYTCMAVAEEENSRICVPETKRYSPRRETKAIIRVPTTLLTLNSITFSDFYRTSRYFSRLFFL